jgi:hypothetical protein
VFERFVRDDTVLDSVCLSPEVRTDLGNGRLPHTCIDIVVVCIAVLKRIFGRISKRRRIERNVNVRVSAEVRQAGKYVYAV